MNLNKNILIKGAIAVCLLVLVFLLYKVLKNSSFFKGLTVERTLAIIKPDAVQLKHSGKIIDRIEQEGFNIVAMKKVQLTKQEAEGFYAVHKERPFFGELVNFMTSGPVIIMVLEKESAIKAWRDLMGTTDPAQAEPNTLRKLYGTNKGSNATHGSDAPETAAQEIKYFFPELSK